MNHDDHIERGEERRALLATWEGGAVFVGDPLTQNAIINLSANMTDLIKRYNVPCLFQDEGCQWSGPLNKLKAHLNTCQKDAVSCLNACGAKIARLMMEDHMLYTCGKRLVACQYCRRDFTGAEVEEHQSTCGFEPVHCDNKCGARIQRNRLKAHRVNTCSKRMVGCQYCERSFTAETLQVIRSLKDAQTHYRGR